MQALRTTLLSTTPFRIYIVQLFSSLMCTRLIGFSSVLVTDSIESLQYIIFYMLPLSYRFLVLMIRIKIHVFDDKVDFII